MQIKNLKLKINNPLSGKNYDQNGQSMFEVVIAIFIISLIIISVVTLSTTAISNSSISRNGTLAGRYAQEAIEWLRDERSKNITLFKSRLTASQFYCLNTLAWNTGTCGAGEEIMNPDSTPTVFKREVTLTNTVASGKNIIKADVKVYWTDAKGTHEVKSVTEFSDLREIANLATVAPPTAIPTPTPAPTVIPTSTPIVHTPTPTSTPCINLSFGGGSASPSTVFKGGAYTITCTYSAQSSGISKTSPGGTCNFAGWNGNTARWNCTADNLIGNYTNRCRINTPNADNHCLRVDPINDITVQ